MKIPQQDIVDAARIAARTFVKIMDQAGVIPERTGGQKLYELSEWLPVLIEFRCGPKAHSLEKERARLAANQADKEHLRVQEMRGEIVQTADVLRHWQQVIGECRAKLLNLAQKAAPEVVAVSTVHEAREAIDTYIHEALSELASSAGLPEKLMPEDVEDEPFIWEPRE